MLKQSKAKQGFTLIELLTVIAILAILGAIIFPTVGQFRTLAKKTSDSNDLRNIVQASQLFAAQNGERFVGSGQTLGSDGVVEGDSNDIVDVAAILAYGGELTDPQNWVSANEQSRNEGTGGLFLQTSEETGLSASTYSTSDFSYGYITGLRTSDPSHTPVAFTRISELTSPTWSTTDPYDDEGGHIAFLGGSVSWYENLSGLLVKPTGETADSINEAITGFDSTRTVVAREPTE
ncbi:type II secretion system protein [Pelagicoccus albus]|uniref:Type II secretion system protein n=1 Tax=Pelagicoccus albus TaxID=415222 RepID=A0A7X1B8R2_9BACT|nr:type II secretion system protein [Pelagicoccus albus]MBC2607782.1 type II secretion system protein [Pelagicoccus albus]